MLMDYIFEPVTANFLFHPFKATALVVAVSWAMWFRLFLLKCWWLWLILH